MQSDLNVASILGGKKVLGKSVRGTKDLISLIEQGLPWDAALQVKERLAVTDREYAAILGVSERTLSRHKSHGTGRLSLTDSDRLYRVARIFALARLVLEHETKAVEWLRRVQVGLGGRTALEMMRTEAGAREVEDLLGRIEYGVYA